MAISILDKPYEKMRYPTIGDWVFKPVSTGYTLHIDVADLGDPRFNILVAFHEFIEAYLCNERGIAGASVDAWDLEHKGHPDPGSIPNCPYYREHMFATILERAMAAELNINWDEYEAAIERIIAR